MSHIPAIAARNIARSPAAFLQRPVGRRWIDDLASAYPHEAFPRDYLAPLGDERCNAIASRWPRRWPKNSNPARPITPGPIGFAPTSKPISRAKGAHLQMTGSKRFNRSGKTAQPTATTARRSI